MLTALAAILARYHLGAANWQETVSLLPVWKLVLLVACAPVAWVLIEFLDGFFRELIVLARSGGKNVAQLVGHAPEALKNVLGRGWDRVAACLSGWCWFIRRR